jgi:hypothetical protein
MTTCSRPARIAKRDPQDYLCHVVLDGDREKLLLGCMTGATAAAASDRACRWEETMRRV